MRAGEDGRLPDARAGTFRVLDEISEPTGDSERLAATVRRAKAGDDLAFAELYIALFDRVFRFLHLTLKNRDDAQEAAQDVFVKVFAAIDRYDPARGGFESWLFSLVRNLATDRLRRTRRAEAVSLAEVARPETMLGDRAASLLERLDPDGGARAMVDALPEGQRRALVLRFVFDFDTTDVADVLGTTPDAVRHLQHRGLKALVRELGRERDPLASTAAAAAR